MPGLLTGAAAFEAALAGRHDTGVTRGSGDLRRFIDRE
jgi:hypothetical protein